jgi:hypothetical protein
MMVLLVLSSTKSYHRRVRSVFARSLLFILSGLLFQKLLQSSNSCVTLPGVTFCVCLVRIQRSASVLPPLSAPLPPFDVQSHCRRASFCDFDQSRVRFSAIYPSLPLSPLFSRAPRLTCFEHVGLLHCCLRFLYLSNGICSCDWELPFCFGVTSRVRPILFFCVSSLSIPSRCVVASRSQASRRNQ